MPSEIPPEPALEPPAYSGDYSIETRGLNLWYGDFQALRDIEVRIKPGVITALIGPSGCGKTTLLRCFNRINERYGNVTTTGEVTVLGKNIYDHDVSLSALRKSVGMVFQRPNPLPISIYENVLFGVRVHTPTGRVHPPPAGRNGGIGAPRGATVGRGQGPAPPPGDALDAGAATEAVHRPAAAAEAAGDPHGRALFGVGHRGNRADRGIDRRAAGEVHDCDCHAQHGPSPAGQPRVHFHAAGPNRGTCPDVGDVSPAQAAGDGNIHPQAVTDETKPSTGGRCDDDRCFGRFFPPTFS